MGAQRVLEPAGHEGRIAGLGEGVVEERGEVGSTATTTKSMSDKPTCGQVYWYIPLPSFKRNHPLTTR